MIVSSIRRANTEPTEVASCNPMSEATNHLKWLSCSSQLHVE